MPTDGPDPVPQPEPRYFRAPTTTQGRWAVRLTTTFFLLIGAWLLRVSGAPERTSTPPEPLWGLGPLLIAAVVAAVAAGGLGCVALLRGEERSAAVLVSVLLGALVLYWTVSQALTGS